MLKGRDFIVFSDDWGRHPSSCQHIMKQLLSENRALWVHTIGLRNPTVSFYDMKRGFEKLAGWLRPSQNNQARSDNNLTIVDPFMTPYQNIDAVRAFNCRRVKHQVKTAMLQRGFKSPILLTTLPNAVDFIHCFDEACVVYYCVDDFTKWPGVDEKLIARLEEQLLANADLVFASANELRIRKTRAGKSPIMLSHGVDYEHFQREGEESSPEVFRNIPRPVVGFFGAISPWLDFDLIATVAKATPNMSYVFIGPTDTDVSNLRGIENIYWLGSVPYDELPQYARGFDVGIIPFLLNDLTISVNPLKLLEYFACGLPVVATDMPEARSYRDTVYIARTADEFVQCLYRALADKRGDNVHKMRNIARMHSWHAVAEKLSINIEQLIGQKN